MEMPKFGATTNPSLEVISEIKDIGALNFDFVEIGIEDPCGSPKILAKRAPKINKLLKKYGMFSLGHAAWWIDLGSPSQIVRETWLAECENIIDVAKKLNAQKITFHAHSQNIMLSERSLRKEIIKNYISSAKSLVDYAGDDVMVVMENTTEMSSDSDFGRIISGVKGLGVNLDIGHAFISGGMKNVTNHIRKFSKNIHHIHMHDNHGKSDEHLPIGLASIDFRKVVGELKKIKYSDTISLEVFVPERIITKISAEIIREMWG
ncbi:MAG: sugar phosphate isomerase/epimerase family protein [Candidatus Aenigmatarchaeota archaeon]